ncbi:uracil-DNA glycosylase superfamily protein [Alicycliphilus sp. B1]|nr:uracil-DNA glycosylase superfamily protein [Alicycliphilus sp. B1]
MVLGQYALAWHLPQAPRQVTRAVQEWQRHWPHTVVLPHPSPRNNGWLAHHPWFEAELLPQVRRAGGRGAGAGGLTPADTIAACPCRPRHPPCPLPLPRPIGARCCA